MSLDKPDCFDRFDSAFGKQSKQASEAIKQSMQAKQATKKNKQAKQASKAKQRDLHQSTNSTKNNKRPLFSNVAEYRRAVYCLECLSSLHHWLLGVSECLSSWNH